MSASTTSTIILVAIIGIYLARHSLVDSVDSPMCLLLPVSHVSVVTNSSALHNSFALIDGGTESLGITAGETENPSKNMPRVVKLVFWR